MPRHKRRHSRKRISKAVSKGYSARRYGRKRSAPVIRGINYVRQRCTAVISVQPAPGSTQTDITCFWQQTGDVINNPVPIPGNTNCSFNQSARFPQVVRNYDQYSITGMKIEYIPMVTTQVQAPQQNIAHLVAMFKGDDLDDYGTQANMSDTDLMSSPGFKSLSPFRAWKKFYSMKKISKQQNVSWQDNQTYNSAAPNFLTPASTLLRWKHTAAATATPMAFGALKVTWYLHMRGQVI